MKALSTVFFGCNYAGVLYGAFTFNNETNENKKKLFLMTALKHAVFMSNNYLIHMLKFDLTQLRRLNLMNDIGSFLCCFPAYFIIMYPGLESLVKRDSKGPDTKQILQELSKESP
jgi:hypothetical protein